MSKKSAECQHIRTRTISSIKNRFIYNIFEKKKNRQQLYVI